MTFILANVKYTTLDKEMTFVFDFVQSEDGYWRVNIVSQPDYRGRATGAVATHRLFDRVHYICWDAPIPTLDAAKGVARAWADATQAYIYTGRFPPPGPNRFVPDDSTSADFIYRSVAPSSAPRPPGSRPAAPLPRRAGWLERLRSNRRP